MRIQNYQEFNENLGISLEMEKQVDDFFKIITNSNDIMINLFSFYWIYTLPLFL